MGKREVTQTTRRTVLTCDLCDREVDSYRGCAVCRRQVGYCCSRQEFFGTGGADTLIEFPLHVCKDCYANDTDRDRIAAAVGECNQRIRAVLDQWRAWADLRRKPRAQ